MEALTICLVLSEHLTNHYAGPLARGALRAANVFGYRLIIYTPLDANLARSRIRLRDVALLPQRVDGYLLPGFVDDDLVAFCRARGAALLTYADQRDDLPTIGPDNRAAARDAVLHLIALGRTRIVHLMGLSTSFEAHERLAGYRDALEAAEVPFDPALVVHGNFRVGDAQQAMMQLIAEGIQFDAIFAANDQSARGALAALHYANLRVPNDVALVGFDDSVGSSTLNPPLTTVRQSAFQIGWDAMQTLARQIRGESVPHRTVVPTRLVVRESCGSDPRNLGARLQWDAQLALWLGSGQGQIIQPADVAGMLAPLDDGLEHVERWMQRFDDVIARMHGRDWNLAALRDYLSLWRTRRLTEGIAPTLVDLVYSAAKDRLARALEDRSNRERQSREDRLNALNYVIDLLRETPREQLLEVALRYLVHSGAYAAISSLLSMSRSVMAAQYIGSSGGVLHWQGAMEEFPPAEWLEAGDALVVMPLAGSSQQGVIGVLERGEQAYIDLDDLLLRSINTHRSSSLLQETLRELEIARSVQLSMLPRRLPTSRRFEIAASTRTARQVGGDLYGCYVRPDGTLALAVGDVIGKGMPAALLMSACVTTLAGILQSGLAPGQTLSQMHRVLQPYLGHGQQAGICLAFLDAPGADAPELPGVPVCIANAGMVAPVLRTAAGVQLLEVGGMPLGSPLAGVRPYQELTVYLQSGDMLLLSSDGIVEAMNIHGELYGFERLWATVAAGPDNAEGMLAALMQDVSAFVGEADLHDDIVAMVVVARE